jgi:electron transport complex protein RnfG
MDTPNAPETAETPRGKRSWIVSAIALTVVIALLTVILAWLANATRERIAANRQSGVTAGLRALMPAGSYDNDLLTDSIAVTSPNMLGTSRPVMIYRARQQGRPVAAIARPIAPDGYRGAIELLVAIAYDGTLIGVQVLHHNETPGLGDAFESREADWLEAFSGLSLHKPPQQRWAVRKDGGDFDAFTGATITPRAIVKAIRRTLEFYRSNRDRIFAQQPKEAQIKSAVNAPHVQKAS